jgi:hypothetical protein
MTGRIIIEAISADQHRYPTEGDWYFDRSNGDLHIKVTGVDLMSQNTPWLYALHEFFEAKKCFLDGVTEGAVDAFDIQFEKDRAEGKHPEDVEPGDDPAAPYRLQHRAAMVLEHTAALLLGIYDHGEVR